MSPDPKGRVAVITGASSGIGRATARIFARAGIRVVLGARRADRLQILVEEIRQAGGQASARGTDVTRAEEVRRLVEEAETSFGRVDILVNNAGVGYFGPVESMPEADVRRLLEVNVLGTVFGIQAVVPLMRRQRSGHIINISSILGKRATPVAGMYAATKFAVSALSEALRVELQEAGIHVSNICPVGTATEFFDTAGARSPMTYKPTGPIYTPEQVAAKILRCVRRPRPEVLIYPPTRFLVILNALAPGLVDRGLLSYWKR